MIEVRQWSDHLYAAYAGVGSRPWSGTFVGTAASREEAAWLAVDAENRYATTGSAAIERVSVGQCRRSDGSLTTSAGPDRTTLTKQGERL